MKTIKINADFFGKHQTEKELYNTVRDWVKINLVGKIIEIFVEKGQKIIKKELVLS